MTTEQIPTSEVLYRAADLIEERGWWQDGGVNDDDHTRGARFCVGNAISKVMVPRCAYNDGHKALLNYLIGDPLACVAEIYAWNDAIGRTAAEVIEVLRACAVIEAAREQRVVNELAANGVTAASEAVSS